MNNPLGLCIIFMQWRWFGAYFPEIFFVGLEHEEGNFVPPHDKNKNPGDVDDSVEPEPQSQQTCRPTLQGLRRVTCFSFVRKTPPDTL